MLIQFSFDASVVVAFAAKMTVTMNTATKDSMPNQFGAMNPVYGPSNTIPTICMSLYPAKASYPAKKPVEPIKTTSSLRKLIPIISGLLTFATVLSILIIFMDTSGKNRSMINLTLFQSINCLFPFHFEYFLDFDCLHQKFDYKSSV